MVPFGLMRDQQHPLARFVTKLINQRRENSLEFELNAAAIGEK